MLLCEELHTICNIVSDARKSPPESSISSISNLSDFGISGIIAIIVPKEGIYPTNGNPNTKRKVFPPFNTHIPLTSPYGTNGDSGPAMIHESGNEFSLSPNWNHNRRHGSRESKYCHREFSHHISHPVLLFPETRHTDCIVHGLLGKPFNTTTDIPPVFRRHGITDPSPRYMGQNCP